MSLARCARVGALLCRVQTWRDAGSALYVTNLGNLLRDQGRLRDAVQLYTR